METAYVPEFLQSASRMEILSRVEAFMNLSVSFTSRVRDGKDNSVKTMKALLQHQPLQGLTVMNDVMNLLKDVVLGFEHSRLTGNVATLPPPPERPAEKPLKLNLFPKDYLKAAYNMLDQLWGNIYRHKAALKKLKKVQMDFIEEHAKLKRLKSKCEEVYEKHTDNLMEGETKKKLKASEKLLKNIHKQHDKQKDKTLRSLARVLVIVDQEKAIRFYNVKESEKALRDLLEYRIYEALNIGYENLVKFAQEFSLPEHVQDVLDKFDVHHVAKTVYRKLCSRYIYPTIESYTPDVLISPWRFDQPDLSFQQKDEIRLGRSESCMDLLSESSSTSSPSFIVKRREELYVWACEKRKVKDVPTMMTFGKGQKIKQKYCCGNGDMAFGWKKFLPGGPKVYGFYPTHSVQLVP